MRLRRSDLDKPGIARKRRGKGFAYYDPEGNALSDPDTLQRIKELVIPPAWKKVWIAPYPNGHIQAVGTDAAGRRQYIYHAAWQQERAEETVAFTPPGLQSGAAAADGAPTMPMVNPPSRQPALMPATRRRATILLIFMISLSFEFDD